MKEEDILLDWAEAFFKHKDLILKNIEKIEESGSELVITFKTKKLHVVPTPNLAQAEKSLVSKEDHTSFVTFNTKENFDTLLKRWDELSGYPKLNIFFINPLSKSERKWFISPATHSRIADKAGLKQGLTSMFASVETMSSEVISSLLATEITT